MRQNIVAIVFLALIAAGVTEARADISFSLNQGEVQPDENLLFNEPWLVDNAITVQGVTNQTDTVYNISSDEVLVTPSNGQARVSAADGSFDLFFLRPANPNGFFAEFEANLITAANTGGTATVSACNQAGNFAANSPFTASGPSVDGGPCESFTFSLGNGENFFVLTASDGQLLRGVRVETTNNALVDVRQIRIGGSQSGTNPITPVSAPEPGSLILLGSGLLAGARAFRKRRAQSSVR